MAYNVRRYCTTSHPSQYEIVARTHSSRGITRVDPLSEIRSDCPFELSRCAQQPFIAPSRRVPRLALPDVDAALRLLFMPVSFPIYPLPLHGLAPFPRVYHLEEALSGRGEADPPVDTYASSAFNSFGIYRTIGTKLRSIETPQL